jgi:subtilase family serine protease
LSKIADAGQLANPKGQIPKRVHLLELLSNNFSTKQLLFLIFTGFMLAGLSSFIAINSASVSYSAQQFPAVSAVPLRVSSNSVAAPSCSSGTLCPSELLKAYGFNSVQTSGVSGKGQTIVVVDACGDPSIVTDLNSFDSAFGLSNPTLKIIDVGGKPTSSCTGWTTEVALDVEWAHVTAPSASIDLLVSANAGAPAMYQAWSYALNNNLGYQISNSWGGAGCSIAGCNDTIGQGIGACTLTNGTQGVNVASIISTAKSKHVTLLVAAGDSGTWGLGTSSEEPIPGDCPGVLTVGGTQLSVGSGGKYSSEIAWSGSGGGYASAPKEPAYQKKAKISDPYDALAKPDVAADASTPVWVFVQGAWLSVIGTSVSTPLWAGFMADVNQLRVSNGFQPAGSVDSFLYSQVYLNSTLYKIDFHDITSGSNAWAAGPGWDAATGLGSFVVPNLAQTLGSNENA